MQNNTKSNIRLKQPKVSITVPCWGHTDLARQLYEGVKKTFYPELELILVDNGDGVPDDLPKEPWLKIIKPGKNLGFGKGHNLGVKHATGEIVCLLNNDVQLGDPLWLQKLVEPLLENPKRLVGSQLVTENEFVRVHGTMYPYINGWCMVMYKELFEKVGGFDAGFGLGWFEDVYFSIKAQELGYELYEKIVGINHIGSQTIADGRLNTNKLMVRAGYHFRQKVITDKYPKNRFRIVFMCQGNYKFSDESWEGKGVGGAEASLILLTRELAKLGHQVDVYNDPEKRGTHNGVHYYDVKEFRYTDYCDVFVVYRNVIEYIDQVNSPLKIFWSCDQRTNGNFNLNVFPYVDKTICISDYHKKYFTDNYEVKAENIQVFDLGVQLSDYETDVKKVPGKVIFCSVPRRGLNELSKMWSNIKAQVPNASLYITSDYRLWGMDEPLNEEFQETFRHLPDVHFLGKVSRKELVQHQLEAEVMAYPCIYDENFCIAAAECMAAGAIPVTYDIGALKTTIKDGGIIAKNDSNFIETVVKVLKNNEFASVYRKRGKEIVKQNYDWSNLAKQWEMFLYEERKKKMINLLARLPEDFKELSVLDLGCGDYVSGVSSQIPLIPFNSYLGVDIYEKDLESGKKKAFQTKKRDWILADIRDYLKGNRNQYDLIFLFDVIEHFSKEDAKKILKDVEKMCKKRIIIFMPIGEHTLEANDGRVKEEQNEYQKHLSEWSVDDWEELGYDVELLRGFHHSGTLDAAWIIRDTNFMKECNQCGRTFNSSYYLAKHMVIHGVPETKVLELEGVPLAQDKAPQMPPVKIYFTRKVDIIVNQITGIGVTEIQVPYETMIDVIRMIKQNYGEAAISHHEFL